MARLSYKSQYYPVAQGQGYRLSIKSVDRCDYFGYTRGIKADVLKGAAATPNLVELDLGAGRR